MGRAYPLALQPCTGKGKDIKSVRENLIKYIKDNLYISGMKYRTDIGARVESAKVN